MAGRRPAATPGLERQIAPLTAEQDHRRLLKLLGIDRLRPGADGQNSTAPNAVNYDDARADPCPTLPPLLTASDGSAVTREAWPRRRAELLRLFEHEIYGRIPATAPDIRWTATAAPVVDGAAEVRRLIGRDAGEALAIEATISLPVGATGPVPAVLGLAFPKALTDRFPPEARPTWREQVLARGYAVVEYTPVTVQADDGAGLAAGVIGLAGGGQPRGLTDWGALRAWGWGASQVLDALEATTEIDESRVAIFGLSRYGKAALVAMAFDPRFAAGFIASSGQGGAKLMRRDFGERVENVASSGEYHWMAGAYLKYAGPLTACDLPIDAHQLIALCAPRPVFISVGNPQADAWTDPRGMFMAAAAASPAYALLGARPLASDLFPPLGTLVGGDLAFRQHEGGHTGGPNWPVFLDWWTQATR
ncbi:MAG: acetylxylan esterase [Alphaproteobacteria bacterium]|nr:acetylxylan esterase [Alphaproteobacteria bacterium]MBU2380155.1 acetylxylan esterase [Alphaproteobacteria bacterium]